MPFLFIRMLSAIEEMAANACAALYLTKYHGTCLLTSVSIFFFFICLKFLGNDLGKSTHRRDIVWPVNFKD